MKLQDMLIQLQEVKDAIRQFQSEPTVAGPELSIAFLRIDEAMNNIQAGNIRLQSAESLKKE